jgi:hypothetical protein
MCAGIQAAGPGMHLQAARPAGRPAAGSPPPSRGAALSESGSPAGVQARHRQPDPALRRGHDLHARLRPPPRRAAAPSPAIGHPASGPGPAGAPGRHGQSQAGEDLGLTASHATPSSSIARGPARHGDDAANTSRRRSAARNCSRTRSTQASRSTAPAGRSRLPYTARQAGRNRLQTLASCRILACSRQPEVGAQEKIGGPVLEGRQETTPPARTARPRARPKPPTSESNGRPGKARGLLPVTGCRRSP